MWLHSEFPNFGAVLQIFCTLSSIPDTVKISVCSVAVEGFLKLKSFKNKKIRLGTLLRVARSTKAKFHDRPLTLAGEWVLMKLGQGQRFTFDERTQNLIKQSSQ